MGPVKRWVLALMGVLAVGFVALDVMQKSGPDPQVQPARREEAAPQRSREERTAHARELVATLSQVDAGPGAITPEKAEGWRQDLLALLGEGTDAVPAIAEYLQKNTDIRFDAGPAAAIVGAPTLRLALIKVLFDIPTPDNVNLQVQVLGATGDPDEVVLLAHQLEAQEPGRHREAILKAARLSQERVRRGEFPGHDAKAFESLLRQYQETAAR